MVRASRRMAAARAAGIPALVAVTLAVAAGAAAETAWVKDEIQLQLRTGAGTSFRIIGSIQTGDAVDVLERGEKWTRVRVRGTDEGWIPSGYLQESMPAKLRLARAEAEVGELRQRVSELEGVAERAQQESEELGSRGAEQTLELERLTRENAELRAGARWPEWVAGAAILSTGMLCGAWIRGRGDRRSSRIRL